jgi:hypothetical protein
MPLNADVEIGPSDDYNSQRTYVFLEVATLIRI